MRDELDALIDRTAEAITAAAAPPSLAPGVQERIRQRHTARRGGWMPAIAVAAAAVLVFGFWLERPAPPPQVLPAHRAVRLTGGTPEVASSFSATAGGAGTPSRARRRPMPAAVAAPVPQIVSGPPALTIPPLDVDPMDSDIAVVNDGQSMPITLEPLHIERLVQTEE